MKRFSQVHYYPALQSSDAEHLAYRQLSDEDKSSIFPIFEINQKKTGAPLTDSVSQIENSVGDENFILDLSHNSAPDAYVPGQDPDMDRIADLQARQDVYNAGLAELLEANNGFENWRTLCQGFVGAVPVLQFTDALSESNAILRQASLLLNSHGRIAARISSNTDDHILTVIGQIIAIVENPRDLLIILDAGQGRIKYAERINFAKSTIARIQGEVGAANITGLKFLFLGDSYRRPNANPLVEYSNEAWPLWDEVNSEYPVMFGDYSAHYRFNKTSTFVPPEWKATVVFPLDESWLVYRHANSQDINGWTEGAALIAQQDAYIGAGIPDCWGGTIFERALNNDIANISTAKYWHAAKMNMHIHRQISYAVERIIDGL